MTDSDSDPGRLPTGYLPSRRRHDLAEGDRVDPRDVLSRLESLDVSAWEDADDDRGMVYLGPAAEDVYEVFEVGPDPERIPTNDASGVALAAVQGLQERVERQRTVVERQAERIEEQGETIDRQRADIETLRERLETLQSTVARLRIDFEERD